ncbi:hypothetical protein Ac2012v2_007899 [Leucoagaricus gongylophorus]
MTRSQPIALPTVHSDDVPMADASFPGAAAFNPASFTRHFLGSPISWRPSSFEPESTPTDSLLSNLSLFDREGELCRNYTCCGLHLTDLHALLEHFEAVHIVLVDGDASRPQMHMPLAFDPDDMELDIDLDITDGPRSSSSSAAPTPPDTPVSTPLSAWASPRLLSSHHITPASSLPPSPRSKTTAPTRTASPAFSNLSLASFSRVHVPSPLNRPHHAFNSYARFSQDYSSALPGAQHNPAPADDVTMATSPPSSTNCVPPALLFSSSSPPSSPLASRVPSPTVLPSLLKVAASIPTAPVPSASAIRANPSLLLSKPFKCPKPNCNKSYKQANGLKYHMTHGSCNFAPPKDLEHVKDLLERKKRERACERERVISLGLPLPTPPTGPTTPTTELAAEYGITETDLKEVEEEAERRLRPFACAIGDCQRRYKNMNGLRYHYQHTGEHGVQGLSLLANGQHDCLQSAKKSPHHYVAIHDRPGKKRLVIRPMPHKQNDAKQQNTNSGQVNDCFV